MRRLPVFLICLLPVSGCVGPQPGGGWPDAPSAGRYDFGWRLSGDRAVAPLQVFDDGRDVWLQFSPGQPLPAIFGVRGGSEHLLPYQRRDPYVRIAGRWASLVLRGGGLQARAQALGAVADAGADAGEARAAGARQPAASAQALPVDAPAQDAAGQLAPGSAQAARMAGQGAAAHVASVPGTPTPARAGAAGAQGGKTGAPGGGAPQGFDAGPADGNMRRALARWAGLAGWTFRPEHWAMDVDIPLTAAAQFPADFKQAVRSLLGATEMSDRPAQPCFYANRVLRVVPWSQPCDRSAAAGGS